MKILQTIAFLLLCQLAVTAQTFQFDKQINFEVYENGTLQEYPQARALVGAQNVMGARVVLEEDAGAQYSVVDFEKGKIKVLMRQFGQKVALETDVNTDQLDVLGISDVPVTEDKKIKKEIIGIKCRTFKGTQDNKTVIVHVGKYNSDLKGYESFTKEICKKAGIELKDKEIILGVELIDNQSTGTFKAYIKNIKEKAFKIDTSSYTTLGSSGSFGIPGF
ncbi:hypothetical protein [Flammeovirga pacifica]|uniref:DUF4412 domain-containing protein n=1 Tax=Flammeovirga pacifica TaxID=915059 RepID=A0A1S1Z4I9_FLAPC|nr:hypothetical protein [Flammeovirga pacifica]OHX68204.1 hypothetical protein NH26_18545 [Flammeovirga pacifica]